MTGSVLLDIITAAAAFLGGVAAVISALKAGEAASGVTKLKQDLSQMQSQVVKLTQSVDGRQQQAQAQAVYTGPVTFTGPVQLGRPDNVGAINAPEQRALPVVELQPEMPSPVPQPFADQQPPDPGQ